MEALLRSKVPLMRQIMETTRQPGMSVGVIHQGKEVFKHNFGVADVQTGQKIDSDTLYCIASLTKAFVARGIELSTRAHGLSWNSKVSSVLKDFKHVEKPEIYSELNLRDICSHRTGLLSLDEITQGRHGRILLEKKDVVQICNALPVLDDFRASYVYNNALFELAGCVIEHLSKAPTWGDYLREHIFEPLGMHRTTAFPSVHQEDKNVAKPYVVLTDGVPYEFPPPELSALSMNGGSGGIRSSLNDMLKWCSWLLRAVKPIHQDGEERIDTSIFRRCTFIEPESPQRGEYCNGMYHHQTPCEFGQISPNRHLSSPLMGKHSPPETIYGHQGDVWGYTCSLYLLPETETALVILSNGTGLSDATDWIAQDLMQSMLNLAPAVNFLDIAKSSAKRYIDIYDDFYKSPLDRNRKLNTPVPALKDLVGQYNMDHLSLATAEVSIDPKNKDRLLMMICGQQDQIWNLWHYHDDVFCFLPDSYDSCLRQGYAASRAEYFLVPFLRDSKGSITGLRVNSDFDIAIKFNKVEKDQGLMGGCIIA